jgi:hypothetical protein
MARKNTSSGPLTDRPSAIAATNTYWFDTDGEQYYYSDGTVWREQNPDFTDIDPSTDAVVSCGVTPSGSIAPFKVTSEGYQRIAGTIGQATSFNGEINASGVAQQIVGENLNRKYLLVQNVSSHDMRVGIGIDPVSEGGLLLPKSGGSLICDLFIPTQAIYISCDTDGTEYVCLEG